MNLENAKKLLNKASSKAEKAAAKVKKTSKTPGIGWEIGAYAIRGTSVAVPASVIMCLENSWVKTGLGFMAAILIIAMLLIFKEPIKKAANYAPGVIPFAIFVIIAIFFDTSAKTFLTVGLSGLSGCALAIPFHTKYLSYQKSEKSPELEALETIAKKLK